jgi:fructose-bisphosphate aldolase class I
MNAPALQKTARQLVAKPKGILAADESTGTMRKRLESIGLAAREENVRRWRELLFMTPHIAQYLNGVILYEDVIPQRASDGAPMLDLLTKKGILAGIKPDKGTADLPGFPGERITRGLEGLPERLAAFKKAGFAFAKWRDVFSIGPNLPSEGAIQANAKVLAHYAAACQQAGIVPIIEPEVLIDGVHGMDAAKDANLRVLTAVFAWQKKLKVDLKAVVLKPSMVIPGKESGQQASADEVADATVDVLMRTVPEDVPGVAFLSGGQTPQEATERLSAMNRTQHPWNLTFSYSRALEVPPLHAWAGKDENAERAQEVFRTRLEFNSLATRGEYAPDMEP